MKKRTWKKGKKVTTQKDIGWQINSIHNKFYFENTTSKKNTRFDS
jgi:hypothetical protein